MTNTKRGKKHRQPAIGFCRRASWTLPLLLLAWPAGAGTRPAARLQDSRAVMGTVFSIVAYGDDEAELQAAVSDAFRETARVDRAWSNYREDSQLSNANQHAAEKPVTVDPELFRMLETCLRYSVETEGAFDISVGPLLKTWKFFRGAGRLPAPAEIAANMSRVGWKKVRLDPRNHTVAFSTPGVELDLGGIGKGYAVDRAARVLSEAGIRSALIVAGGSSIVAIGAPPGQEAWTVDVRDPRNARKTVAQILLKNAALATSGSHEKSFSAGGHTYSHIFDPRTGYPAEGVLSTTVVGATGTETDALSTAFFVLGKAKTISYLKQHPGLRVFMCVEAGCEWLKASRRLKARWPEG